MRTWSSHTDKTEFAKHENRNRTHYMEMEKENEGVLDSVSVVYCIFVKDHQMLVCINVWCVYSLCIYHLFVSSKYIL